MTCRKCGELLSDNAKFCTACGAKVEKAESQAETTVINPVHTHYEDCVHEGYVGNPKSVGFLEAIKLAFVHFADFKGRARRSEYWWFTLFNIIVTSVISAAVPDYSWIWSLVVLVPGTALVVRRLHDVGKRGWFYLWIFLPLVGYILMLIQLLKDSGPDNQWGPNPKH